MKDHVDDMILDPPSHPDASSRQDQDPMNEEKKPAVSSPTICSPGSTEHLVMVENRSKSRTNQLSVDIKRASTHLQPSASHHKTTSLPRLTVQIPVTAFGRLKIDSSSTKAHETVESTFNIFDALMEHNELLQYFTTKILLPSEFLALYSISKAFHLKVNIHQTSYILSAVRAWAPVDDPCPVAVLHPDLPRRFLTSPMLTPGRPSESLEAPDVLPFSLYKRYCHLDPMLNHKPGNLPMHVTRSLLSGKPGRAVPSFRYLFFIVHELAAARAVLRILWEVHGLRVPADTLRTMGKLALLMHARQNAMRLALIHNTAWFTDADIFRANTLFMKLDMAFTDPLRRTKPKIAKGDFGSRWRTGLGRGMRQLLCAQRGWSVCARVLARHDGYKNRLDFMRLWSEWSFIPPGDVRFANNEVAWGLRVDQLGRLASQETAGRRRGPKHLMPVEEYVVREGVKRSLDMHDWILEMMICGFIDPKTKDNLTA